MTTYVHIKDSAPQILVATVVRMLFRTPSTSSVCSRGMASAPMPFSGTGSAHPMCTGYSSCSASSISQINHTTRAYAVSTLLGYINKKKTVFCHSDTKQKAVYIGCTLPVTFASD